MYRTTVDYRRAQRGEPTTAGSFAPRAGGSGIRLRSGYLTALLYRF